MKFKSLHHIGVRVLDREASEKFYIGILGLRRHPEKTNWLTWDGAEGYPVHLMPGTELSSAGNDLTDLARHFALEVDRLEDIVDVLLAAELKPFSSGLDLSERRYIQASTDDLSFGIGTVFVEDPDANIVEFVQRDRGIFARYK